MSTIIDKKTLSELADLLIDEIKTQKSDPFETTRVVFPNLLTQQWFKVYWLKTQKDAVLMNVKFETIDSILPFLVEQKDYHLIKNNVLRQIIIDILTNNLDTVFNDPSTDKYKEYCKSSPVKLFDFASSLSQLFIGYYLDNFENLDNWDNSYQKTIYDLVIAKCSDVATNKYSLGTIEKPVPNQNNNTKIYFFGFNRIDKVYRYLLDNCPNIIEYSLSLSSDVPQNYDICSAPSSIREIESIHSEICKRMQNDGVGVSDFLVVAPSLSTYVNTIERVFRQDEGYPDVPYVISYREQRDSDTISALKMLYQIYKKGFYTRADFSDLVSNPIVKKARGISDEEIENWLDVIVQLNIYRQHPSCDDWDYLKKRLLLSKVSSINFANDNIVSLQEGDYLPFSNIGFDDDSILKIVNLIDDIKSFCNLLKQTPTVTLQSIDLFEAEFNKWFVFNDDKEFNNEYQRIISSLDTLKLLDSDNVPLDIFFYSLFADGQISTTQKGDAFMEGVTFVDFDINHIYDAKYIFFIGASSNNLPVIKAKSELDLRTVLEENSDDVTLNLLCQAADELHITFTNVDLKSDEDFYLTPIVVDLNKVTGKYIDKENDKIPAMPLDEKRDYENLFTKKEFKEKEYYAELINGNSSKTANKAKRIDKGPSAPLEKETISIGQMGEFLDEPLSFKANQLFNKKDEIFEEINKEFEPFSLDNRDVSPLITKIVIEKLNGTFDEIKMFETLTLDHSLSNVNDVFSALQFAEMVAAADTVVNNIKQIADGPYDLIGPRSIGLVSSKGAEWTLTSSKTFVRTIRDNTRTYIELKRMEKNSKINSFLNIYVLSLMDLAFDADKLANEEYTIVLAKGLPDAKPKKKKYENRSQQVYKITPQQAIELLNKIYDKMSNLSDNVLVPLSSANEVIDSYYALRGLTEGEHALCWKYFEGKGLFDREEDLGFDSNTFRDKNDKDNETTQAFLNRLNEMIDLIKYLEPKIKEDDKKR